MLCRVRLRPDGDFAINSGKIVVVKRNVDVPGAIVYFRGCIAGATYILNNFISRRNIVPLNPLAIVDVK